MIAKIAHLGTVEPVELGELSKLQTGSRLDRRELLGSLPNSFETSDWFLEERDAAEAAGLVGFKETVDWDTAFAAVRRLLNGRERMPRGSNEKRLQAAYHKHRTSNR